MNIRFVLLIFSILPVISNAQQKSGNHWHKHAINSKMYGYRWFEMEAFNEELHVLYFANEGNQDYENNWLTYAYSPDNGKTWSYEKIDGRKDKLNYRNHVSITPFDAALCVDSCGNPHIFYTVNYFSRHNGKPSWAIYMQKQDGLWQTDTIDSQTGSEFMISHYVDMEIGSDNEPRLTYLYSEEQVVFAQRKDGEWQKEIIPNTTGPRYLDISLELDDNDNPHMTFGKWETVEYCHNTGDGWQIETIPGLNNIRNDLALDSKGRPHVVYSVKLAREFRHTMKSGNRWIDNDLEPKIKDPGGGNGQRIRIKIDDNDRLHVTYYEHVDNKLKDENLNRNRHIYYGHSDDYGRSWQLEAVDTAGTNAFLESTEPDIIITGRAVGIFYKSYNIPHYAYKKVHYPKFHVEKFEHCKEEKDSIPEIILTENTDSIQTNDTLTTGKIILPFEEREIEQQHVVEVNSLDISISVFDDAELDGDSISLKVNDQWLLEDYPLTRERKVIDFSIEENADNSIVLYALNEGSIPPNTVTLLIRWGDQRRRIRLRSDYQMSGAVFLKYVEG